MLPKPDACSGCPWYGDGQGYVPDLIPEGAKLLVLLQNPGKNEEEGRRVVGYEGAKHQVTEPCPPQPLIGPTGFAFYQTFLPLSGVDPSEVGLANVLRCRRQLDEVDPATGMRKRTNDMPSKDERGAIEHCTRAYLRVPDSVQLIVAQGAHAWRLLGGPQPLDDWRGYLAPDPVYAQKDGTITPRMADEDEANPVPVFATLHLADLNHRPKMDLPTRKDFLKIGRILESRWPWVWPPILNANTLHEDNLEEWFIAAEAAPFVVIDTEYDRDTKALSLLGLAIPEEAAPFFVGYSNKTPVLQYHWYEHSSPGRRDDFTHLLTLLVGRVPCVFQNVLADMPVLQRACGLDWSSFTRIEDTMQAHAVLWCELPHTLEFQASMDSRYNKTKHLMGVDIERYNAGDLMDTVCAWQARLDDFSRDTLSRGVYNTQMLLLPHLDRAMSVGIAVDAEKVLPAIAKYQARAVEGERMAHAYCGWPINLRSDEQMKHVLYELEGMPVQKHPESRLPTTNADAIATLRQRFYPLDPRDDESITPAYVLDRIAQGAHPLLEAHVLHAHADHVMSHYLLPLVKGAE